MCKMTITITMSRIKFRVPHEGCLCPLEHAQERLAVSLLSISDMYM